MRRKCLYCKRGFEGRKKLYCSDLCASRANSERSRNSIKEVLANLKASKKKKVYRKLDGAGDLRWLNGD